MTRLHYPLAFALAVIALTAVALTAYGRISTEVLAGASAAATTSLDTTPIFAPTAPSDHAAFADADREWRAQHARFYTLDELRVRGDGTRSPRQALQDRVYEHTRRGELGRAIAELESWIRSHPSDQDALLWQARLLASAGRTGEAVRRYREVIALKERGSR
ncbi:MAG: BTAD domain-containing putative transcriptional regulator [Longimicrobiales bacterium]